MKVLWKNFDEKSKVSRIPILIRKYFESPKILERFINKL